MTKKLKFLMGSKYFTDRIYELFGFILLFVGLDYYFSGALMGFIADSEIWSVTLGRVLFEGGNQGALYYKPFFHFVIKIADLITETNVEYLIISRLLFALVGCGILYFTYKISMELTNCRNSSLTAVLLLLFSSIFLVRGYRIRSDILSTVFHLINVLIILRMAKRPDKIKLDRTLLFISTLLMFLCTPKALYFFISQIVLGISLLAIYQGDTRRKILRTIVTSQFGFIALGLSVPLIIEFFSYFSEAIPSTSLIYYGAYEFFVNSFNPDYGSPPYFSEAAFSYILLFLARNKALALAIYLGLFFFTLKFALRHRSLKPRSTRDAFFIYSVVILLFLIFHNDRLPFFVCSMLPPLIILSTLGLRNTSKVLSSAFSKHRNKAYYSIRGLLFLLIIFLTARSTILYVRSHPEKNRNFHQITAIKYMENYFETVKNPSFYDVIGTMPKDNTVFSFVGPGEIQNLKNAKKNLNQEDPEVILYSNKMFLIEPFLSNRFLSYRAPVGFGVFAPSLIYKKQTNENLFPRTLVYKSKVYREFPIRDLSYLLSKFQPQLFKKDNLINVFKSKLAIHTTLGVENPILIEWKDGTRSTFNPFTPISYLLEHARALLISDQYETNYFTLFPKVRLPFGPKIFYMRIFRFDVNY